MWEKTDDVLVDCIQLVSIAKKWGVSTLDILDLRDKLKTTDNNLVEAYYTKKGIPKKIKEPKTKGAQTNKNFDKYKELVETSPHLNPTELAKIIGVNRQTIYDYSKKLKLITS